MSANVTRHQQTFSFSAPGAQSVLLAGDFTHWQKQPLPLHKQPNGVWKTTVALSPGTYHYKFLVDGEWRDDPDCTLRVRNPFGTEDAVLQIGSGSNARKNAGKT